jgi:hypothetical protein
MSTPPEVVWRADRGAQSHRDSAGGGGLWRAAELCCRTALVGWWRTAMGRIASAAFQIAADMIKMS